MTIGTLLNIREGLRALVECDSPTPLKLTGKERYDIFRAFRKAKKATEDYDKAREGLITQLGTKQEDGSFSIPNTITVDGVKATNPSLVTFIEEDKKLRDIEVDYTLTPFPVTLFQESPQVSIGLIDALITAGVLTD
jgi:hypothetical protein